MKLRIKRLDHVQVCIPSGEEEKARQFYGGILGLEEIEKPDELKRDGGMWYSVAGIQLHISIEEPHITSKHHPAFEVEDLDGIRSYLPQQGVRIREEVGTPGMERLSFFDPFGNRIELIERRAR